MLSLIHIYDSNWGDKLTSYNGETITYDESGKLLTKINHSNTDYIIDYDKFYNPTEKDVYKRQAINDGAIIAAGAVVTNDVPSCAVAAGVPAKVCLLYTSRCV